MRATLHGLAGLGLLASAALMLISVVPHIGVLGSHADEDSGPELALLDFLSRTGGAFALFVVVSAFLLFAWLLTDVRRSDVFRGRKRG